jgi:hypothetical protein
MPIAFDPSLPVDYVSAGMEENRNGSGIEEPVVPEGLAVAQGGHPFLEQQESRLDL